MKENNIQRRMLAVERFNNGESPEAICASLHKSRSWLYKWVSRYNEQDASWSESRSSRPKGTTNMISAETIEIIKLIRLNLYNQDLFCGAQAIQWEMEDMGIMPLPSIRTINRILSRHSLTHRRTGKYEAKGTAYPALPSVRVNQTHQADLHAI
jgi:putative transposase